MRTNSFWAQTFWTPPGVRDIPAKFPGHPRFLSSKPKEDKLSREGTNFPFAWKTPTPPGSLWTQKVNLCALFSCPKSVPCLGSQRFDKSLEKGLQRLQIWKWKNLGHSEKRIFNKHFQGANSELNSLYLRQETHGIQKSGRIWKKSSECCGPSFSSSKIGGGQTCNN